MIRATQMAANAVSRLVELNRDFAQQLAQRIYRTLPRNVDIAEIQCFTERGLARAANAFIRSQDYPFRFLASREIRVAIFHGLAEKARHSKSTAPLNCLSASNCDRRSGLAQVMHD